MAVTALSRSTARARLVAGTLPPVLLLVTLVPLALDLLGMLQPVAAVPTVALIAAGLAAVSLAATWLRYPRTTWLAAAVFASLASVTMRTVGADVAPALSILAVVALGIGGGFASRSAELETWLA